MSVKVKDTAPKEKASRTRAKELRAEKATVTKALIHRKVAKGTRSRVKGSIRAHRPRVMVLRPRCRNVLRASLL